MIKKLLILLLLCSPVFGQWQNGIKPMLGRQIDWSNPLSKGLVYCGLFNEGTGDKVADLSGNGNYGIITAADWKSGKHGPALFFDSGSDEVDTGLQDNYGKQATIVTTLKCTTNKSTEYIFGSAYWTDNEFMLREHSLANNQFLLSLGSSKYGCWTVSYDITTNASFLAAVVNTTLGTDAERVKLYANGEWGSWYAGGNTSNLDLEAAANNIKIGDGFAGSIEFLYFYNRALSAQEIQQLYLDPFGMFGRDDIVWWSPVAPISGGQVIMIGEF